MSDVEAFRVRLTAWRDGLPGKCRECRWFRPDMYWPGSAIGLCTRRSVFERIDDHSGCGEFEAMKKGPDDA